MDLKLVAVILVLLFVVAFARPAVASETVVVVRIAPVATKGIISTALVIGLIASASFIIGGIIGYQVGRQSASGVTAEAYVQDISSTVWAWSNMVRVALRGSTTFLNFTYTYIASYASLFGMQYCSMPELAPVESVKNAGIGIGMMDYLRDVFNVTVLWVGESARFVNYMQWRWSQAGRSGYYYSVDKSVVLKDQYGSVVSPPSDLQSIVVKLYADGALLASAVYVYTGSEVVYSPPTQFNETTLNYVHERLVNGFVPSISASVKYGAGSDTYVSSISIKQGSSFTDAVVSSVIYEILSDIRFVYKQSRDAVYAYVRAMYEAGCPSTPLPLPTNVLIDPSKIASLSEEEKLRIYLAYLNAMSSVDWKSVGSSTAYIATIATNQSFVGDIPAYGIYDAKIYVVDFGKASMTLKLGRNVLDTWVTLLVEKNNVFYYVYLMPSQEINNDSGEVTYYRTTVAHLLELTPSSLPYTPTPTPEVNVWMYVIVGLVCGAILALALSRKPVIRNEKIYVF